MKVSYFGNFKSVLRGSSAAKGRVASRYKTNVLKLERGEVRTLEVDLHTRKDLEIFESEAPGKTLFASATPLEQKAVRRSFGSAWRTRLPQQTILHRRSRPLPIFLNIEACLKSWAYGLQGEWSATKLTL